MPSIPLPSKSFVSTKDFMVASMEVLHGFFRGSLHLLLWKVPHTTSIEMSTYELPYISMEASIYVYVLPWKLSRASTQIPSSMEDRSFQLGRSGFGLSCDKADANPTVESIIPQSLDELMNQQQLVGAQLTITLTQAQHTAA